MVALKNFMFFLLLLQLCSLFGIFMTDCRMLADLSERGAVQQMHRKTKTSQQKTMQTRHMGVIMGLSFVCTMFNVLC